MHRLLFATILTVLAPLLLIAPASARSTTSNPDHCQGQIMDFTKVNGQVKLRYRIVCQITQKRISVEPLLKRSDGNWVAGDHTCYNNWYCEKTVYMSDPAGSQAYSARPQEAIETIYNYAYRSVTVACIDGMTCAAATKYF